jgi:hypothetical protein
MFEAVEVSTGKLNFISVGSKFRSQLVVLMEKLKATVSSFNCLSKIDSFGKSCHGNYFSCKKLSSKYFL